MEIVMKNKNLERKESQTSNKIKKSKWIKTLDTTCNNRIPDWEVVMDSVLEDLELIREHLEKKRLDVWIDNSEKNFLTLTVEIGADIVFIYSVVFKGLLLEIAYACDGMDYYAFDPMTRNIDIPDKDSEAILEDFADTFADLVGISDADE